MAKAKTTKIHAIKHADVRGFQFTDLQRQQLPTSDGLYQIMLINLSPHCMELARFNNRGKWFAIPRTCTNCNTNCDDCYDRKQYTPILSIRCSNETLELSLSSAPDKNGNGWGATWTIQPSCNYAGGVLCLG